MCLLLIPHLSSIIHFNLRYHIPLLPLALPSVFASTLPGSEHWWCIIYLWFCPFLLSLGSVLSATVSDQLFTNTRKQPAARHFLKGLQLTALPCPLAAGCTGWHPRGGKWENWDAPCGSQSASFVALLHCQMLSLFPPVSWYLPFNLLRLPPHVFSLSLTLLFSDTQSLVIDRVIWVCRPISPFCQQVLFLLRLCEIMSSQCPVQNHYLQTVLSAFCQQHFKWTTLIEIHKC